MRDRILQKIIAHQSKWIADTLRKTAPYEKDFLGLKLTVFPQVFPPCGDSRLLGKCLKIKTGSVVLDMGSGSGAQALIALKGGAQKVVATDISPIAVENIKWNARKFSFEDKIDIRYGALFKPIRKGEIFDVIIFNPPFLDFPPGGIFEKSVRDKGLLTTRMFFKYARNYLKKSGTIFMVFANWGKLSLIHSLAKTHGYKIKKLDEAISGVEEYVAYSLKIK